MSTIVSIKYNKILDEKIELLNGKLVMKFEWNWKVVVMPFLTLE